MRQFSAACLPAASLVFSLLSLTILPGCSGAKSTTPAVAQIVLTPSSMSLNQGQVQNLSSQTFSSTGGTVAADVTFSTNNPSLATVSSGGAVCAGTFDANNIVCTPATSTGQATITATSGGATATLPVYVHLPVDRVVVSPVNGCASMGTLVNPTATAYNTTAQGCSVASPCDITSTVGPIGIGSSDSYVVSSAAGINPTFSSATNSPTYTSGGTITGSKGQTCNLSDFSVGGSLGIDPTFDPSSNSPTYASGGAISGTGGQTCTLSNFNNVSGATATVTLTGTNVIATGAQLTITNQGFAGTAAPTTATLGNGTATCSGTANVTTKLAVIPGGSPVTGATGTVTLTGSNTIASGTQLSITNQGFGATLPPTTARLSNGTATCSGTANVVTALNGATGFKAQNPGATTVFGSVSGVTSVGQAFIVCPVASISVHDANGSGTNFSLAPSGTQSVVADVLDSAGNAITPTLTWGSSLPAAATVTGSNTSNSAAINAVAAGTAAVTATCSSPDCNKNLPSMYSYDVAIANVSGSSSTTVYAASSQSTSMVPITVPSNAIGTAITLPNLPNSIISAPSGKNVYLGSESGVMVYTVSTNTVATLNINSSNVNGTVVAISPDGNYLLVSDPATGQSYYINVSTNTIVFTHNFAAASGVFTPDSKWLLSVTGQSLSRDINGGNTATTNLGYVANSIDLLAQGSLAFITSSSNHEVDVRNTCNLSDLQTLAANAPTLVKGIPNGTGAVAADPPNIDVITTAMPSGSCPVVAQNTLSPYNLGIGSFTPTQLFLSSDSSHAFILSNQASLVSFNLTNLTPAVIPLANTAVPTTGGVTTDGALVYVGASDDQVHMINVGSASDAVQIVPGLKNSAGTVVPPDLVTVLP